MKKKDDKLSELISTIEGLGKKWVIQIILTIKKNRVVKFSYLQKLLNITGKSLSLVLKSLLNKNIIQKTILTKSPTMIVYSLTGFGNSISDAILKFPIQNKIIS